MSKQPINNIIANDRVDANDAMIDASNVRAFWDVEASNVRMGRIVCEADMDRLNYDKLEPADLLNMLPAGAGIDVAIKLLVDQICKLNKRLRRLENEMTDKIILDSSYDDPKPNR